MSILIKGMEMPKDREMLRINIYPNGVCINLDLDCKQIATAVPVPPHGRLIDADSMEKEVCGGCTHGEHKYANCIDCALAHAHTIIEAEVDE